MSYRVLLVVSGLGLAALGGVSRPAEAQGWKDRLIKKGKEKVEQRVDRRVDQAMDKGLDKAEGSISCVVSDRECLDRADREGKSVVLTDASGRPVGGGAGVSQSGAPGKGAWVNYDFVPGEKTLFAEDFSRAPVGDFPERLTLKQGNMEVAELDGARYLRATSFGELEIPLAATLPQNFTLEFDYMGPANDHQFLYFGKQANPPTVLFRAGDREGEGGIEIPGRSRFVSGAPDVKTGVVFPVRVMADGKHVKVYLNGTRVANVPQVDLGRDETIRMQINAAPTRPVFIGNVRVATGTRKLYDALAASGRVATQGIYFDVGSDRIRPESTPTLKEIAAMLSEHPELELAIEGHTDNTGDADANQVLSERRAAAVRNYLTRAEAIDADRLTPKGLGASKPVAPNTTPEGRQQNRRVELVRM